MRTQVYDQIEIIAIDNNISLSKISSSQQEELTRLTNALGDLLDAIDKEQNPHYSIETHGLVTAIRVFIDPSAQKVMARFDFERRESEFIEWTNRYDYSEGITCNTVIKDERVLMPLDIINRM